MAKHAQEEGIEEKPLDAGLDDAMAQGGSPEVSARFETFGHHEKSHRQRIVLIVVSVVLAVLVAVAAYCIVQLVRVSGDDAIAVKSVQSERFSKEPSSIADAGKSEQTHKETPRLVGLIGKTEEEAIGLIGRGATETSAEDIVEKENEEGEGAAEVVGRSVVLTLAEEPTDSKGNAPAVYLTLDADGLVVEAGYSASVGLLGYGDVSFIDAVTTEHIVENLVSMAGVSVEGGSVEMPSVDEYRTYADDGTTIAQEMHTFKGSGESVDGGMYSWSCKLSYDYSAANVSGNLSDTVRQVHVNVKAAS